MRQPIGVAMMFARLMHDFKIKWLKPSDPACNDTFWLLKVAEPPEAGMISHRHKVVASQVVLEELNGCYCSQELLVHGAISPLTHIECFRGVCNHSFDYAPILLLLLLQYSAHSHIASIC